MTHPRGLSDEEAAAWEKVAATVAPLDSTHDGEGANRRSEKGPMLLSEGSPGIKPALPPVSAHPEPRKPPLHRAPRPRQGDLDSHWSRRIKSGRIEPDFSLDLHGHSLDQAYTRLMRGMAQARSMQARVVLVVTGRLRPVDPADRGTARGAIRAKILDWLAASEHGDTIAAVRKAHRKHGGEGALYLVLRR